MKLDDILGVDLKVDAAFVRVLAIAKYGQVADRVANDAVEEGQRPACFFLTNSKRAWPRPSNCCKPMFAICSRRARFSTSRNWSSLKSGCCAPTWASPPLTRSWKSCESN